MHLLLLPLPFGPALLELLGFLLLGKAHGLLREEVIEAFKATIFLFWTNGKKARGVTCRSPPGGKGERRGPRGQPAPLPRNPAGSHPRSPQPTLLPPSPTEIPSPPATPFHSRQFPTQPPPTPSKTPPRLDEWIPALVGCVCHLPSGPLPTSVKWDVTTTHPSRTALRNMLNQAE